MKVAVLKEMADAEKRVAAVPATVEKMVAAGMEVLVQTGAGLASGFRDADYQGAGAKIDDHPEILLAAGDVLLTVQRPSAEGLERIPEGVALIAYSLQSRGDASFSAGLQRRRLTALSLDLLPTLPRPHTMPVLTSLATTA